MPKIIDAYLWVSHGANVSTRYNYYKFETKFKYLTFYSLPFQLIDTDSFEYLFVNPCKIITGTCPLIPIRDKETDKKFVYLPPLVFTVQTNDNPTVMEYTGLYYLKIEKVDGANCKLIKKTKLLDHGQMIDKFGNNKSITYSNIFECVTKHCKKHGLNPKNVVLGIFSCQEGIGKQQQDVQPDISDLIPKMLEEPSKANIYDTVDNYYPSKSFVSPTIIVFNEVREWTPLAGITHQGCGLNVLSYYNIIEQQAALEQTVCLSMKGTSIFKIIDYINSYLYRQDVEYDGFMVVRYSLLIGLRILFGFLQAYSVSSAGYYAIITKLYRSEYQKGTRQFSQIGHSVSFAKVGQDIYYIDPQMSVFYKMRRGESVESMEEMIKAFYHTNGQSDFDFMDIIYSVIEGVYNVEMKISSKNSSSSKSSSRSSSNKMDITPEAGFPADMPFVEIERLVQNIEEIGAHIVPLVDDISYGGRRRKRHSKKSIKYSKNKNSKTRRIRKTKLDTYEALVLKLDKTRGVHSALSF